MDTNDMNGGGGMPGQGMPMYPNGYMQQPQGGKGMAIASMIFGILAMITCCFPIAPLLFSVLALILGIVSIVKKKGGKGMAIAGIVCGAIAFFPGLSLTVQIEEYIKIFKMNFEQGYRAGQNMIK